MILTEYDEKKTMRMFREEALQEGQNRIIKRMAKNGASAEEIARLTNLPLEEIRPVCQK